MARGRRAAAAGDLPAASAALGFWRGAALAGLDGPHAAALAQGLQEARLAAAEDHARVLLAMGQPGQATGALAGGWPPTTPPARPWPACWASALAPRWPACCSRS